MPPTGPGPIYPQVPDKPDFPAIERNVLTFWGEDATFEASVKARSGAKEFVFYDGPPFANGLPHYGSLLTGFVKDAIPRYKTMRGYKVERRFGWDCHGLPAEMEAVKELGLPGRTDILRYGVGKFNDYCRTSVMRYTSEWERYVTRQARWVDFANDYKTMDLPYMESVMWAFKQLYDKGLLYEGYRVLPYCWECETPLSNSETRMDDSYRPRHDPGVTVAFELSPLPAGHPLAARLAGPGGAALPLRALVWTTTPWTLPSNLALAVGPELSYAVVEAGGAHFVLAEARWEALREAIGPQLEGGRVVATVTGAELAGLGYRPLFDFFAGEPGAFVVLAEDFVTTDEGTGIVHLAPGFGEDDQRACEKVGIRVVCPVDSRARFTAEVPPYEGMQVFEANRPVIAALREKGALVAEEDYVHSYPHCWRTDTPLVYRAVSSWFVRVTAIREQMLALNQQVTWVPAHVRDGAFGKWLEGARDWSISRNRFWGSPIPVWASDDPAYPRIDVYGSLAELERDFGVRPADLHRPAIDSLVRPNPDDPSGRSKMRRVEDVLDCWFESGSMPFAQVHYPFDNAEWFEEHFPADFIVEYVGQTRGWFYTLHVLATALFGKPAFETCLAHGIVLGEDRLKLSKRLRNYPDPDEMFERYGADAMRWYLLSSAVMRGSDLVIERKGPGEATRAVLNPLYNAWKFFSMYANADGHRAAWRADQAEVLDRYVLSKARLLAEEVTEALDAYDLYGACSSVSSFLDALNNWYIRRSRDRFWSRPGSSAASDRSKADAYDTLYTVLHTLCLVSAPLLPMLSEHVYRGLSGERSVHLADWPDVPALPRDTQLVARMDTVREVCSAGHSVRKAAGLRSRLPLASATVAGAGAGELQAFADLVADELNVKQVHLVSDVAGVADLVLQVNLAALGPRIGPATQEVIAAVRQGAWRRLLGGGVEVAGHELGADEYFLSLVPKDPTSARALSGNEMVVSLDLEVTAELEAEGLARDVVRQVQEARKRAGLDVSDHIRLSLGFAGDPRLRAAVEANLGLVAGETLAEEVVLDDGPLGEGAEQLAVAARRHFEARVERLSPRG
ncbi:MAG: isoleucine--tRNA ligase [Actinomycetota bacterium]|nr:isoleucine--tRNA ligase [Actinomycetota bacterium]